MDELQLIELRDIIENMEKIHHEQIFKIFKKHKVQFSENKNGIFINISEIKQEVLLEIKMFIKYIQKQEHNINEIELEKSKFKQIINQEEQLT